jgi:S1-C subfamily serine protease
MKKIAMMIALLFSFSTASATTVERNLNVNMNTEPVSAAMSSVEKKVRDAAVTVVATLGGHGSGSLVKYKDVVLVITAQHVADGELGATYHIMKGEEIESVTLVYSDPIHDIALLYVTDEMQFATPMKYSPRKKIIDVGEEVTYSGYPSTHQLMTFRGRVAGYEILSDAGIQILLHTHGWFGCSGSVVYDAKGNIVGVLWGVDIENDPYYQVIGNLIWIVSIEALDIDDGLKTLCRSTKKKLKACK